MRRGCRVPRPVAGNLAPDHSTIAEFRCRHERALGEVFSGVLGLCARAGLASVGVVAIDGTKMAAHASSDANREFGQIAREILAEAAETDRREDERYGAERGDELPENLRTREGRRKALREAKERLERKRNQPSEAPAADDAAVTVELDPRQFVTRPQGRRAWVREGRRALEAQRERAGRPIAKDRIDRQRGQACLAAAPLAVVLPIPGTLSIEHLRENLAALALELGEVHDITA